MNSSASRRFRLLVVLASFAAGICLVNPSMVVQAVTVGGEVFLKGDFVEVGIHATGSFGTVNSAPAGFHPKPEFNQSSGRLGFVVDPGKDGWTAGSPPQSGDYFVPGTPEEGWSVEWTTSGDRTFGNYGLMGWAQIPGTSLTETSSGDTRSAVWEGQASFGTTEKLKIIKTIHFKQGHQFFVMSTVMTNVGTTTLNSVEFMRNVDPDQEQPITGNYATSNYVANGGDRKLVVARGLTHGITLGLGTIDSRAVVSAEGFSNRDPDQILNSPVMPTAANPRVADEAIALAYRFGSLAPGQSVSFDYAYILNEADLESALADLGAVSILQPIGIVSGANVLFQATTTALPATTKIEFYVNGAFVDADFAADAGGVFETMFDSRLFPNGTITLKVVATFADGRTVEKTSSASVDNSGPPIAFATPTPGARFAPATTIPVEIVMLDPAHPPARVSFFRESASSGSVFLGLDTLPPFTSSFTVTGLPDGETVIIKAVGSDSLNRSTTIQVAGSVELPSFSAPVSAPDGACICTPLLMNSQAGATQYWWMKAGPTGAVDMTVYAVAMNGSDPATVEAVVYDRATDSIVAGPVTTGYPAGTAPATETSAIGSFSGTPGAIYRLEVKTPPPTPSAQSHYRLALKGAEALGAASPTSPSFDPGLAPGRSVRWKLNRSTAAEALTVRVFTTGVPLTQPTNEMLYRWIDPSGVASEPVFLSTQRSSPSATGIDAVISAPAGPGGTWTLDIMNANDHYRLDKQTGADRAIYLTWDSFGTSPVRLGVTPAIPVDVRFTNTLTGDVRIVRMTDGAMQDLPVGSYRVSATGAAGQPMEVSQQLIDVLCDAAVNLSVKPVNSAPSVSGGGPYDVEEGTTVVLAATGADPDGHELSYAWDLDSDGVFETPGQHTTFSAATEDGPRGATVGVRATDSFGLSSVDAVAIAVLNVAPAVTMPPGSTIHQGQTFTGAGSFTDPGPDTWSATVDYGDGSGPQPLTLGGAAFALNHAYAEDGTFTITVTVTDDDDGVGTATATISVINNAPVVSAGGPYSVPEGGSVVLNAAGSDPDGDVVAYEWDLDSDGVFETSGAAVTFSAAALDGPSASSVTVRATDVWGLSAEAITVVDVRNVAPALTLSSAAIDEGGTATLALTIADPGASDTHQVVIDWNDGAPTVLTLAAGVLSATVSHTYVDDNPSATPSDLYTVIGTVSDDDEGVAAAAAAVRVTNLPPLLSTITAPTGPQAIGTPVAAAATYTDAGADTFTCSITWGDGAATAGTASGGSCTGTHAYAAAGVYTLIMTLTDDDTGSDTETFQYVVVSGGSGFVTGGGWFTSAPGNYHADPAQSGRANFGFNARHRDGRAHGQTEFRFGRNGGMSFHSSSYDWLVVSGPWALYVGSGTINGSGDYAFLASVVDGRRAGDRIDRLRIKIWDKATGAVIFDNNPVGNDYAVATAPINNGNVVIH
jgi:hypothetical protein